MSSHVVTLVVPREHVKSVKTHLEASGILNHGRRIERADIADAAARSDRFVIQTTIAVDCEILRSDIDGHDDLLAKLNMSHNDLQSFELTIISTHVEEPSPPAGSNLLQRATRRWLADFPSPFLAGWKPIFDQLLNSLSQRYNIYPPMLLLPPRIFSSLDWRVLFYNITPEQKQKLFRFIADAANVTHIAINAPIPLHQLNMVDLEQINTQRRPTQLTPLYGDFGSSNPSPANASDFATGFWVSSLQNGITQVWAPLHTMFSRGNVTEKARILHLHSVASAVSDGQSGICPGSAAVDLYAGIGYFAFSYVKAGVDMVLCWEVNPWSVEGLRRGAGRNGWIAKTLEPHNTSDIDVLGGKASPRLLVFHESNELALQRIDSMRERLPPIRHVNCGLLPTACASMQTAVLALDPELGGWMHFHENIALENIDVRAAEVVGQVQKVLGAALNNRRAVLEHIERVKTFAPGVIHCVLDIHVSGIAA